VGHETDFTIADFVADLRAPTPSAAAELTTEAQHKVAEHLVSQIHRLDRAVRFQLLHTRQQLAHVTAGRVESRIAAAVYRLNQRLDEATLRLDSALAERLRSSEKRVAALVETILHRDPRRHLAHLLQHLAGFRARLDRAAERLLEASAARLAALDARLNALSPLAVLDRGYALVLAADGTLVRSTSQIAAGHLLTTRLADGSFNSRVEDHPPSSSPSQIANQKRTS